MKRHSRLPILFVLLLLAGTAAAKIDPAAVKRRETDAAAAIQKAYEARDGKSYRRFMTQRLAALGAMSFAEKKIALAAYRDLVRARGAQGLEGLLLSAHGAVAASGGRNGYAAAQDSLAELRATWRIVGDIQAPNALVPVARPGLPYVHHLPVTLVRATVANQLKTGVPLVDQALADASCNEQALSALAARYGQQYADLVRSMCRGIAAAPSGAEAEAGGGLGFTEGMSMFNCLMAHQETRAERFDELMQACSDSLVRGGGGANPLASGSNSMVNVMGILQPLPDGSVETTTEGGPPPADYQVIEAHPGGKDVVREYDGATGDLERIDYKDERGDEAGSAAVTYDGNGDIDTVTWTDADGKVVAVSTYSKDADGNTVVTTQVMANATFDQELGSTPECRQLSMFVISDRLGDDLARDGLRPPGYAVDPSPDGAVRNPDPALDCLSLTGGALVEASIQCRTPTLCVAGKIPDASCSCKPATGSATPQAMCGAVMRCAEGKRVIEASGQCHCESGEVFEDNTGGIGPLPVDSPAARVNWSRR